MYTLKVTNSSSLLEPILLSLLHEIAYSLSIYLNNIFCRSLLTSFQYALITYLLKKPNIHRVAIIITAQY